jgi:membrane protein
LGNGGGTPIAGAQQSMVDRLKVIAFQTDAWIIRHRWSRVSRRAVIGFMHHNALNNAGSMAYFAILSVFQLLVLGVVVLSFFLGDGKAREFIIEQIQAGTPLEPDTIAAVIDGVIRSRGGIGLISFVALLWGGLGVFSALNRGIASAFIHAQPRGFLRDKLIGIALIGLVGILGILSVVIGIVTGILQNAAEDVLSAVPGGEPALALIGFFVPILLIFLAFLAIYRITPNRPVTVAEVWPGALVATVLWSILRIGFTYYATDVAKYDTAFGPISAAISLLVFLYFASVVVLLGAEVARANVLDDEIAFPRPIMAEAVRAQRQAEVPRPATPATNEPPRTLPAWSLAVGSAVAGRVVRWLSLRLTGRRQA